MGIAILTGDSSPVRLVCRTGFAGRGTPLAGTTVHHTLVSDSDPRRVSGRQDGF
jgi:hypothetical protein